MMNGHLDVDKHLLDDGINLMHDHTSEESIHRRKHPCKPLCCSGPHSSPAKDGSWAWIICLCGLLCNTIAFGCCYTFGLLYPPLLKEFGQGKATTALVGSLALSLNISFAPLASMCYDRFGPRRTAIFGGLLSVVGLGCSSPINTLPIMFLTYCILFGFGSCCVQTSVFLAVPRYFIKRATLALGLISTGTGTGILVFSAIIGACLQDIGWRGTLLVMSGISMIECLLALVFQPVHEDYEQTKNVASNGHVIIAPKRCPSIWKNYALFIFALMETFIEFGAMIVLVHLANYTESEGIPTSESKSLYQMLGVSSMVARVTCGYLIDRFSFITPLRAYRANILALGATFVLIPVFASQYVPLMVLAACWGCFHGSYVTAMYAYQFSIVAPHQRSRGFGITNLGMGIGSSLGPPFAGVLVDKLDSYPPAFYLAGAIQVFAILFSLLLEVCKPVTTGSSRELVKSSILEAYHELLVVEKITVL